MMHEDDRFSQAELDLLEDRLWALVENHYPLQGSDLPVFDQLFPSSDACDSFAEDLLSYADAVQQEEADSWRRHPLLDHLDTCLTCQETLRQVLAVRQEMPTQRVRPDADVDISIFDRHLPDDDDTIIRQMLDPRRPALLGSDFLNMPAGWHYTLEAVSRSEDARPSLLLTLLKPHEAAAGVDITLVSLGQILHGTTDDEGRLFFAPLTIPRIKNSLAPSLTLRFHVSEPAKT